MACFTATVAEAVVISAVKKLEQKKEEAALAAGTPLPEQRIPWSRKLGWLSNLLWGGSLLLLIEHIWHGEVTLWPPFLTAMNNPADIQPMLMEILTVGGGMILFVTAVWFAATLVADRVHQKSHTLAPITE